MPLDKYAEKAIIEMGKAGKATLVFTVESDPEDDIFATKPPSVDLYILPKDKYPEVPEQLPSEYFRGTISSKQERAFTEKVESLNNVFRRVWNKKAKREPKDFLDCRRTSWHVVFREVSTADKSARSCLLSFRWPRACRQSSRSGRSPRSTPATPPGLESGAASSTCQPSG